MFEQLISTITDPSLMGLLQQYLFAITSVVTAASAITALTPTKKDDKIRQYLLSVLNFLALNIGNAAKRNKDDV